MDEIGLCYENFKSSHSHKEMCVQPVFCGETSGNNTYGSTNVAGINVPKIIIFNVGTQAVAILSDANS